MKKLRYRVYIEIETSLAPGRDMLRGIAKFAREVHNWDVIHSAGHWSLRGTVEPTDTLADPDEDIDGIITRVFDTASAEAAKRSIESGIPVVDVLGDGPEPVAQLVHTDDQAIGHMAANHLKDRGFRRFAACGIASSRWSKSRVQGFAQAVGETDLPTLEFDKSGDTGAGIADSERAKEWLTTLEQPVGIFASCDHIAPFVLGECNALGITVPHQIAVIGVNNDTVACNICNPTLSSIDASHFEIGYRAARILNDLMQHPNQIAAQTFIPPKGIVVRESSGARVIEDPVIARAARFISRNAASPIGVDDVAAEVSLSRRDLQRRFPKASGRTVSAALIEARIEIARRLLASPDYTVDAVAQMSGFGSRQNFAKCFREKTGQTPGAFRKSLS